MNKALSIDWEDYFQVNNFSIDINKWEQIKPRIERNTNLLLNMLKQHNTKATFFILGWNAKKFPKLVKKIHQQGHEIACHGYSHKPITSMSKKEFEIDVKKAIKAIKKACGVKPIGYRASTFSITEKTLWALDILKKNGFKYDSSMVPVKHPDYGIKCSKKPFIYKDIIEFPITTKCGLPVGGGYFRLYPYFLTKKILQSNKQAVFYIHPWEFDPKQPRRKLSLIKTWRHYQGINSTTKKFKRLLKDFKFKRIDEVLNL